MSATLILNLLIRMKILHFLHSRTCKHMTHGLKKLSLSIKIFLITKSKWEIFFILSKTLLTSNVSGIKINLETSTVASHLPRKSSLSMSLSNSSTFTSCPDWGLSTTWGNINEVVNIKILSLSSLVEIILRSRSTCTVLNTHLIHLIPDWVKILLDHITPKCSLSNIDLGIGVTLALHHTAHLIIFGNQTLCLQQDDSQQPLQEGDKRFSLLNVIKYDCYLLQ